MPDWLVSLWNDLSPVHGHVFGLLFSLITATLIYSFRPKVKIQWGVTSNFHHSVPHADNTQNFDVVFFENYFIQNTGRKPARKVQITIAPIPKNIQFYPPIKNLDISYDRENLHAEIPFLAPWERVNLNILNINTSPSTVTEVRCEDHVTFRRNFWVVRKFSAPVEWAILATLLMGLAYLITLFLSLAL